MPSVDRTAIDPTQREFLLRLLQTPGPSGFEGAPARVWRAQAESYGAEVSADVVGNSTAVFNPGGSPAILFVGHLDEIGVIVHYIDDNGLLYISAIGGWDPHVLVGQRIRLLTRSGECVGVIGRKPIHLMDAKERDAPAKMAELWIDIGATSRADAETLVSVGDPGVIDAGVIELANDRLASRSIDNRVGAFVVLEAARRYAEQAGAARVIALAATQEEIGHFGGGVLAAASRLAPALAIVVDVTFATDHGGLDKKRWGAHSIGGGPVLGRGGSLSPAVLAMLERTATNLGIPYTVQANGGPTGTDADALMRAPQGVAVGLVSIPNRYMHSPNEVVAIADLAHCIDLLAATARTVSDSTDLIARPG